MAVPAVNLRVMKRKTGNYYQVDYTVNGNRIRKAVGKNKREAEVIRSNIQRDLAFKTHNIHPEDIKTIDLESLKKEFLTTKKNSIRPSSYRRYENYYTRLLDFFKTNFPASFKDVNEIKSNYLDKCFDYVLSNAVGWSRNTTKSMREKTNSLFVYAEKQGYVKENPVQGTSKITVQHRRRAEFYNTEELNQIFDAIDPFWLDHIKFLYYTGLRKGELINLTWKSVNISTDEKTISVESSEKWETKTGKPRNIPLNKIAYDIIKRCEGKHPQYVFTDKKGDMIHPNYPYNALKKALKKTGIEGNLHKFRHSFASNLVMSGVDLYTVKELLGHSDLVVTEIYSHLSATHLKTAVDKLV